MVKREIKYNCVICGAEFLATKNTHIKTCKVHRRTNIQRFCMSKIKKFMIKFNESLSILRLYNSSGNYFSLGIKNKKVISRSISDLKNKEIFINYLENCKKIIDSDIEKLKTTDYELFNYDNLYSLETYNKLKNGN